MKNVPKLIVDNVKMRIFKTRLRKTLNVSDDKLNIILEEYSKFMLLCAKYKNIVPSKIIDEVWHEHILWTKEYEKFCKAITSNDEHDGFLIHHNPGDESGLNTFQIMYDTTLNLYFTEFKQSPHASVWLYHDKSSMMKYKFSSKPRFVKVSSLRMQDYRHDYMMFDPIELYWYASILLDNNESEEYSNDEPAIDEINNDPNLISDAYDIHSPINESIQEYSTVSSHIEETSNIDSSSASSCSSSSSCSSASSCSSSSCGSSD